MSGLMNQLLVGFNGLGAALLAAEGDGVAAGADGFSLVAQHALSAIIFAVIGLVVLALSIVLMSKLMPLPFWKEIEEDQNTALGIMVGSIVIGISIIIAAAIHG
jgi:putative membrane protein